MLRKKLQNDKALIAALNEFLTRANSIRTDKLPRHLGKSGFDFVYRNNSFWAYDEATQQAREKLVLRCAELLDSRHADSGLINNAALDAAAENPPLIGKQLEKFLEAVSKEQKVTIVLPNYCVELDPKVNRINIGPVAAWNSDALIKHLSADKWKIPAAVAQTPGLRKDSGGLKFFLYNSSWCVSLFSSGANAEEEANWLIDSALSLLRLSCPWQMRGTNFPGSRRIEAPATESYDLESKALTIVDKNTGGGGGSVRGTYEIGQNLAQFLLEARFKSRAKKIFDGPPKSLGEQMLAGLGWLTRARRAVDRGESFLNSFTAIEALLSSDDKFSPVVDTICRNAGVVLDNDHDRRALMSRRIRRLYNKRSALVHRGRRTVTDIDVREVRSVAEALYWRVLNLGELDASRETFLESLKDASFGSQWPAVERWVDPII